MEELWRSVDLFVPSNLARHQALDHIQSEIRSIACQAGEFVHDVRIEDVVDQETGWHKWSVSYVLGPHAMADD